MTHPGFDHQPHYGRFGRARYRTIEVYATSDGDLGLTRPTHFLFCGKRLRLDAVSPETMQKVLDLIAEDLRLPPAVVDYDPCEFCHLFPVGYTDGKHKICLACTLGNRADNNRWKPFPVGRKPSREGHGT